MPWSKPFPDQIVLPDGRTLKTLREAGDYITSLPEKESLQEHWQLAAKILMNAAHDVDDPLHAQIAMNRAINHGQPKVDGKRPKKGSKVYKIIR